MQNGGMHPAATTLFFRAHTRVLTTLSVALAITCLCLSGATRPCAPDLACATDKLMAKSALPLESAMKMVVCVPCRQTAGAVNSSAPPGTSRR